MREAVVPTKLVVVRVRAGAELALLAVLSVREALVPAKLAVVRVTQRVDGKANGGTAAGKQGAAPEQGQSEWGA